MRTRLYSPVMLVLMLTLSGCGFMMSGEDQSSGSQENLSQSVPSLPNSDSIFDGSPRNTPTPLPTATPTPSPTPFPSATPTPSPTPFPTATPSPTATPFPTATPTPSPTPTPTATPSPTATPTPFPPGEFFPRLIISESEIPDLAQKLGNGSIGGIGSTLAATLRGQRHQPAVEYMNQTFATVNYQANPPVYPDGHRVAESLLLFDLQYHHLTPAERSYFRGHFLLDAERVYNEAINPSPAWYFMRWHVNNWTYRHAGSPVPRLLFTGILFNTDPRATLYVNEALKLLTWILETSPNNGTRDAANNTFTVYPTEVDLIDEVLNTPHSYGVWAEQNLSELMHIIDRNTQWQPYQRFGRVWEKQARYWLQMLTYYEGVGFNGSWNSMPSYACQWGHGTFGSLTFYSNASALQWASVYNNPTFAWHYYANPSVVWSNQYQSFLSHWNQPKPIAYQGWQEFYYWGRVAPQHPRDANVSLTYFLPNAGAGAIRADWDRKGANSRVFCFRAGPDGSHDRPSHGAVSLRSGQATIISEGPWGGYDSNYSILHSGQFTNNTLFVDGQGQENRGWALSGNRKRHAYTSQLGPDTFLMDMVPRTAIDYESYYSHIPSGAPSWTRKVHYDRTADIFFIKDWAQTGDQLAHELRFQFISNATMRDANTFDLPDGFVMKAVATQPLQSTIRHYSYSSPGNTQQPQISYRSIWAGATTNNLRVRWAIGKNEAALNAYLARQGGVFVSNVTFTRENDGVHVRWRTDEPSLGRVEFGANVSMNQTAQESGVPRTDHHLVLPGTQSGQVTFRIVALDQYGDATVADQGGGGYLVP